MDSEPVRWNKFRHRRIVWLGGNKPDPNYTETYLTFDLTVRASHLWVAPYNEYQHFLLETIPDFREKGWNFQQIADWLNEKGYLTARGEGFCNASLSFRYMRLRYSCSVRPNFWDPISRHRIKLIKLWLKILFTVLLQRFRRRRQAFNRPWLRSYTPCRPV